MLNLQPPHGKRYIVYDLEIKNPIEGPITWNDHHLMGISVGVAYHYLTGEFKVYLDDNIAMLGAELHEAELISGFNITGFDNRLLDATLGAGGDLQRVLDLRSYDLLYESRRASGWNPSMRYPKGMTLDDHLVSTFGKQFMKTAHGSEAPHMYQRGDLGTLITYCIDDVKRECLLFERAYHGLPVSTPLHAPRVLDRARFSSDLPPPPPSPNL